MDQPVAFGPAEKTTDSQACGGSGGEPFLYDVLTQVAAAPVAAARAWFLQRACSIPSRPGGTFEMTTALRIGGQSVEGQIGCENCQMH